MTDSPLSRTEGGSGRGGSDLVQYGVHGIKGVEVRLSDQGLHTHHTDTYRHTETRMNPESESSGGGDERKQRWWE